MVSDAHARLICFSGGHYHNLPGLDCLTCFSPNGSYKLISARSLLPERHMRVADCSNYVSAGLFQAFMCRWVRYGSVQPSCVVRDVWGPSRGHDLPQALTTIIVYRRRFIQTVTAYHVSDASCSLWPPAPPGRLASSSNERAAARCCIALSLSLNVRSRCGTSADSSGDRLQEQSAW